MTARIEALDDVSTLLDDWKTHLRARNRSVATITSYTRCAAALRAFLVERGMPTDITSITREHVEAFLAHLGDRVSPATTTTRYRSLQQLFRWLEDDGEITRSPMERMKPPTVPAQPYPSSPTRRYLRCSRPARARSSRTADTPCGVDASTSLAYSSNVLSNAGDVCGRCGFLVREVYTLACRCSMVRGQQADGVGHHLVQVCECFFPEFLPKCSDPTAQIQGARAEHWAG